MGLDTRGRAAAVALLAVLVSLVVTTPGLADPAPRRHPAKPVLHSVSPASGDVAGGTLVTIKGRHLRGVTRVKFGSATATDVTRVNGRTVTAVAPPHATGGVRVQVVAKGLRSTAQTFTYTDSTPTTGPPHVTQLLPSIGSYGDQVVVVGDRFTPDSTVTFGGERASVLGWSAGRLTVQVPLHDNGPVQVQVTTPYGSSAPSARSVFTYRPWCTPVRVTTVSPSRGVFTGGTRVDIWGGPFYDVSAVTFGGIPGTDVVVLENAHLLVTTPAHAYGWTDVQVDTRCGQSPPGDQNAQFRFTPATPTVTSVTPDESSQGGARVTITGTHFEEVERVDFGDENGTDLVVLSTTELQVTAPAIQFFDNEDVTVPVRVVTSGGSSPDNPGVQFTWVARPFVDGIYPPYSPIGGGSRILVEGTGFTGLGGVTSVDFGGVTGTGLVVDSDTELHVTAPAHASGLVQLRVTTPAGTSRTSWDSRFSFDTPVQPAGATAVPAPLPGGSTGGSDISDVACPAPGECFAVGSYSVSEMESHPLVERLSGGTWTPTELPLPADAVHPPDWWQDARMQRVTCTAVDYCVAVGVYDTEGAAGSPLFATWDGSSWTVFAYFVGDAVNGDDWIHFSGLDCTADRHCAAVGADLVFVNEGATWTIAPTPDTGTSYGHLNDVDCTATECFAVGRLTDIDFHTTPFVERGAGLSWTLQQLPQPAGAGQHGTLNAVSCAGEGSCTAVGQYAAAGDRHPLVDTLAGGSWTPSSAPQPAVNLPDVYSFLTDVSCATPGTCVAVGKYEDEIRDGYDEAYPILPMVTFLGTAPAHTEPVPMTDVDPVYPEAGMDGVICTAPSRCIGTGGYNMLGHRTRGLVAALTDGDVSSTPVRTPFQAGGSSVHGGSADSATSAVVVGQYVDEQGRYRGLLVTGVPIGP